MLRGQSVRLALKDSRSKMTFEQSFEAESGSVQHRASALKGKEGLKCQFDNEGSGVLILPEPE